jgi:hypothetical protein
MPTVVVRKVAAIVEVDVGPVDVDAFGAGVQRDVEDLVELSATAGSRCEDPA